MAGTHAPEIRSRLPVLPSETSHAPRPRMFVPPPLHLMPGEWAEVRSEAEILATLDESGTLDALPFMAEMRRHCGHRFRVESRADRTIAEKVRFRHMADAVHLEGLRCDGAAHDGCCRGCLMFWKEAWLKRPTSLAPRPLRAGTDLIGSLKTRNGEHHFCQATELARATAHLPARHLLRHTAALFREDVHLGELLRGIAIFAYDQVQWYRHQPEWGYVRGTCTGKTPAASLGLMPGERVRVKALPEIRATLDERGWNRGMEFSREMVAYCGGEFAVLRRVDRIIRDHTARMSLLRNTVLLDGLVYKAMNRLLVPRREYMFWRECWLERVE